MKSFIKRPRTEVDTTFVLVQINPADLEKRFSMKDFIEVANKQFGFSFEHLDTPKTELGVLKKPSKKTSELKTKLENLGIIKDSVPKIETIVVNENLDFNICLSPTNNGDAKSVDDLRNVACWHCKHTIPSRVYPLSLPMKWVDKTKTFEGEGVFCSFNCMMSYSREYQSYRYRECGGLISLLYRKIFGKTVQLKDIHPAPNWRLIDTFGGPMTIEDFRKSFQHLYFQDNYIAAHATTIEHSEIPMITRSEAFIYTNDVN